jgi:hypothetical protein
MNNKKMIAMAGKGKELHRLLVKKCRRKSEREIEGVFRRLRNLLYHSHFMSLASNRILLYITVSSFLRL